MIRVPFAISVKPHAVNKKQLMTALGCNIDDLAQYFNVSAKRRDFIAPLRYGIRFPFRTSVYHFKYEDRAEGFFDEVNAFETGPLVSLHAEIYPKIRLILKTPFNYIKVLDQDDGMSGLTDRMETKKRVRKAATECNGTCDNLACDNLQSLFKSSMGRAETFSFNKRADAERFERKAKAIIEEERGVGFDPSIEYL